MSSHTSKGPRLFLKGNDRMIEEHAVFAEHLVSLEDKSPNVLYIPTAKPSAERLQESFKNVAAVFGEAGVKQVVLLHEYRTPPTQTEREQKFGEADIIYIAGGDSDEMMTNWRLWGLDTHMIEAIKARKRVGGASAGQIALAGPGFSDSYSYRKPAGEWDYIFVDGLGTVPLANTPHFDSDVRKDAPNLGPRAVEFRRALMRDAQMSEPRLPLTAWGITNGAMVTIDGNSIDLQTIKPGGLTVFNRIGHQMDEFTFPESTAGLTYGDVGLSGLV